MMLAATKRWILGGGESGLKVAELKRAGQRNPFGAWLPYLTYCDESQTYVLQDDTLGALWECRPLTFATSQTENGLAGLFRVGMPEHAVLQFIIHAEPYVEPYLEAFRGLKRREHPVVDACAREFVEFLREGTVGISKLGGIPSRNFRLFVALKVPVAKTNALAWGHARASTEEVLSGVGLGPRKMAPEDLLEWGRRLFNDEAGGNPRGYDEARYIRDQMIYAETEIRDRGRHLDIGQNHWAVLTPKAYPKEVELCVTNFLTGGVWGKVSDADQIQTPFLISLNLIFDHLAPRLHAKTTAVINQGAVGSLLPSLARKQQEFMEAVDALERGMPFVRVLQTVWLWGQNQQQVAEAMTRARRVWENCGYVMQRDRGILKALFILSLPFGLYRVGKNLENIARDTIANGEAATAILPVQADFAGTGSPALLFVSRKGQIATLDVFDERANNHNFLVAAETGSGKSFFLQYLLFNYWANNALVRVIDLGRSFRKLAKITGGRYIDFGEKERLCLNPFTYIQDPREELQVVDAVVAQMMFSKTGSTPTETQSSVISAAVQLAWEREGNDADIDTVSQILTHMKDMHGHIDAPLLADQRIVDEAKMLAFNMREFTSAGMYGEHFNGRSTFDIRSDEFAILELEHLKGQRGLFRVVVLLVINAVTQDLYLSDRSRERFILFEEAPQVLKDGGKMMADVLDEGYRRARKYEGAFGIVCQGLTDVQGFGPVGQVVMENAGFKFLLESKGIRKAKAVGLVDYDEFTLNLLETVSTKRRYYSEVFCDTPVGKGVVRLVVDPFFYGICTSSGKENAAIERMVQEGKSWEEAIRAFARGLPR